MPQSEQKEFRPDTDLDRIQANREIGRAFRAVQAVRTFYWALSAGNALYLLLVYMVLSALPLSRRPDPIFMYVIAGIHGGAILLYVVGAIRLHKEPFLWALVVSLVQTVAAVLGVVRGFDVGSVISILLAAFCWAAFAVIAPTIRLMKQYPDLRITKRLHGRRAGTRRRGGA